MGLENVVKGLRRERAASWREKVSGQTRFGWSQTVSHEAVNLPDGGWSTYWEDFWTCITGIGQKSLQGCNGNLHKSLVIWGVRWRSYLCDCTEVRSINGDSFSVSNCPWCCHREMFPPCPWNEFLLKIMSVDKLVKQPISSPPAAVRREPVGCLCPVFGHEWWSSCTCPEATVCEIPLVCQVYWLDSAQAP